MKKKTKFKNKELWKKKTIKKRKKLNETDSKRLGNLLKTNFKLIFY